MCLSIYGKQYRLQNKEKLAEYEKHRTRNNTIECKNYHSEYGKTWYIKTRKQNKQFINGVLDIKSNLGKATIIEEVVFKVLNDAVKCNNTENFCSDYDLISESFGTINVKSSKLILNNIKRNCNNWNFKKSKNSKTPDYYICVGLDANRLEILHVWMIPGYSNVVSTYGVRISNTIRGVNRVQPYEVDSEPYNKVYQELDIYSLPEFCNLKGDDMCEAA